MIGALLKAIGQLGDPRIQKVLWRTLGMAAGLYVALFVLLWAILNYTALFTIGWLETTVDVLGGLAAFVVSVFLFPGVVSGLVGLFLEEVAAAVEDKHYPDLPAPRRQGMREVVIQSVRFAAIMVALNVVVLPLYLIPVLGVVAFYALNGYLLSREYFELVAARRLSDERARTLRKAHMGYLWAGGALTAFGLTVPILNMIVPVIGTMFMVHLFHGVRRKAGVDVESGGSGGGSTAVDTHSPAGPPAQ